MATTEPTPQRTTDHIPTAPKTATLTRAQLDREIEAAKQHEPYLVGYGATQADAAFGGAA